MPSPVFVRQIAVPPLLSFSAKRHRIKTGKGLVILDAVVGIRGIGNSQTSRVAWGAAVLDEGITRIILRLATMEKKREYRKT